MLYSIARFTQSAILVKKSQGFFATLYTQLGEAAELRANVGYRRFTSFRDSPLQFLLNNGHIHSHCLLGDSQHFCNALKSV